MGNCAGCTGPQRSYRVQRLQQNSPIKNRLSQPTKYYPQSNSTKQLPIYQKDKLQQKNPFNEIDMFGNIIGMSLQKSRPILNFNQSYNNYQTPNNAYNSSNHYGPGNSLYQPNIQQNSYPDYTKDILSHVVKTHIKLYPDNPQSLKQISPKLHKSYLYQKQEDLKNSNLDPMRKSNSPNSYSKQLLKSVQSQSKKYLQQFTGDKQSPQKYQNNFQKNQLKNVQMNHPSTFQSSHIQTFLPKFDEISEIRTQKNSKVNYENQNSLPLKKNKYDRGLTVIEEILQEDHKTPQDIRIQRKNNGQDVIFDTFQGFPQQIEPLEIPNFSEYLWALKQIKQKN